MKKTSENNSLLKAALYNALGTFFYFFCQWLITVLVVRISGYEDAGILSLIISTTNLFYCVALFGIRNYQITDVTNLYSNNDYLYSRIVTVTMCLILFFISLFFFGFSQKTILCSMVYIFYKCGEAFSDVIFGCYQKYSNYKQIAISLSLKGFVTVLSFIFILMISNSLFITLVVNVLVYFLVIFFYDLPNLKKCFKINIKRFKLINLLKVCFPLMLYNCMVPYLNFITRFVIENRYGTELLGYYSSITMVFVVMSTLMGSIFVSIVPKIASAYHLSKYKEIKVIIKRVILFIFLLAIVACVCAYFIGEFMFALVFGNAIKEYIYLLIPTIIASISLTFCGFFSSVLISFKENKKVLYCNFIAVIMCTLMVFPFINMFEMTGTLYALTISLTCSALLLSIIIYKKINH